MSNDLVVPATGEVVDLADVGAITRAYNSIRDLERQLREARDVLTEALLAQSKHIGSKTLHTAGGKVVVKGGTETMYDAEAIERELREAGMPEDRIGDIVRRRSRTPSSRRRRSARPPRTLSTPRSSGGTRSAPRKASVSVGVPSGSS